MHPGLAAGGHARGGEPAAARDPVAGAVEHRRRTPAAAPPAAGRPAAGRSGRGRRRRWRRRCRRPGRSGRGWSDRPARCGSRPCRPGRPPHAPARRPAVITASAAAAGRTPACRGPGRRGRSAAGARRAPGCAAGSPATTCSAVRRFSWAWAVGSSRWARTATASACTSSGSAYSRPLRAAEAFAARSRCSVARGEAPSLQVGVGAGGGDQVHRVAPDRLGDVDAADGLDQLHDVVRVRHRLEVVQRARPRRARRASAARPPRWGSRWRRGP